MLVVPALAAQPNRDDADLHNLRQNNPAMAFVQEQWAGNAYRWSRRRLAGRPPSDPGERHHPQHDRASGLRLVVPPEVPAPLLPDGADEAVEAASTTGTISRWACGPAGVWTAASSFPCTRRSGSARRTVWSRARDRGAAVARRARPVGAGGCRGGPGEEQEQESDVGKIRMNNRSRRPPRKKSLSAEEEPLSAEEEEPLSAEEELMKTRSRCPPRKKKSRCPPRKAG